VVVIIIFLGNKKIKAILYLILFVHYLQISLVAPKIMLSLANMLVCQDEKIHRSVVCLSLSLSLSIHPQ